VEGSDRGKEGKKGEKGTAAFIYFIRGKGKVVVVSSSNIKKTQGTWNQKWRGKGAPSFTPNIWKGGAGLALKKGGF